MDAGLRGEIHHPARYAGPRSLLVLGTLPAPNAEAERIFHDLARRNALNLDSVLTESRVVHGGEEEGIAGRVKGLLQAAEESI